MSAAVKHTRLAFILICLTACAAVSAQETAQQKLDAIGARLQRLQDANEVEIVQRTYGYFVDKGMWTEISELFAADGTYEIGGRGVFIGPARVLEYLRVGLG